MDAESLRQVEEILHFLWRHSLTSTSASHRGRTGGESSPTAAAAVTTPPQLPPPPPVVILVANKIDLVRSRIISPQGVCILLSRRPSRPVRFTKPALRPFLWIRRAIDWNATDNRGWRVIKFVREASRIQRIDR